VDWATRQSWLIDATPDFPAQYDELTTHAPMAGILLTHAHMGHYPGLLYLGAEAMNAQGMPVYATPRMLAFLRAHAPWSDLIIDDHLRPIEMQPGCEHALTPDLNITPISVPHRDEYSDTVAWLVHGAARTLFYCPDIDHWNAFTPDLKSWLADVDIALVDGSFFSPHELPDRDIAQIPHPLVQDTARLLTGVDTEVVFVHLNHTNPLWRLGSERAWLQARGFRVGVFGERWRLD
jgi:pyrroloquinoline quinone biosynthesis protein B